MAHSSLRFGIGRFTTEAEVDYVIEKIVAVVQRLRDMRYAVPPLIALLYPLTATTVARCGRWSKRALTLTPSTGPSIKLGWVSVVIDTPLARVTEDDGGFGQLTCGVCPPAGVGRPQSGGPSIC